jgi:hypothetical protein
MITTLQAMKMVAKCKLGPDLNEWIGLSRVLRSTALEDLWAGDAYIYRIMACETFVKY